MEKAIERSSIYTLIVEIEKLLLKKLNEYYDINPSEIVIKKIKTKNTTIIHIRDVLIKIGNIEEEDLKNNLYVGYIKVGIFNMNTAHIAVMKDGDEIIMNVHSVEGMIKQDISSKAIKKFVDTLKELTNNEKCNDLIIENKKVDDIENGVVDQTEKATMRINGVGMIVIIILVIAVFVVGIYFFLIYPAVNETFNYNNAVSEFNKKADVFNEATERVNIDNVSGIVSYIDKLPMVNTSLIEVIKSIKKGNSASKIRTDINSINAFTNDIDEDTKFLKQIENPSKEWIIEKLKTIELIKGLEAVSEGNDPNQLLKKEDGGYQECIYFILSSIKQNEVEGDTIVAKGTDAGGAIEVYATKEDAEQRCEYLADFDNSILYSGSYVPFGTMVIRVSYILNDEQQCYITDLIIDAFSKK